LCADPDILFNRSTILSLAWFPGENYLRCRGGRMVKHPSVFDDIQENRNHKQLYICSIFFIFIEVFFMFL